ncbi:MAG: AMMECR1 domain-containing protein [Candidatus Peribacteraceae bacterium]|nr:AMMECR1 domain-containing protein [Candidatus Peribacteraceae bacterium]
MAVLSSGCSPHNASLIPVSVNGLSSVQEQAIARRAYAALDAHFSGEGIREEFALSLTDTYHKLFITVLRNNATRCCMSGQAGADVPDRLTEDIDQAVERCINDERYGGVLRAEETQDAELIFTFLLDNPRQLEGDLHAMEKQVELGIHSLEVVRGSKNAYFKESVPISSNYNFQKTLDRLCKKAGLEARCYDDPETQVLAYDTRTFKAGRDGSVTELYRYNIPLPEEIDRPFLLDRLRLAEQWFAATVHPNRGLLEYMYYPSSDSYSTENNDVRQLATLWAMVELENFLQSDRLDTVIRNTFTSSMSMLVCGEQSCYVNIDGSTKIAYNAFLILALLGRSDFSADTAAKLAQALLDQQQPDGSYRTDFTSPAISGIDYYPGEAMLALMRFYERTHDPRYLDSVRRAFPYYSAYWRGNKNTAFFPWQAQVYYLFYKAEPNPTVAEFVFEMADWMVDTHQIAESPYRDLPGAFTRGNPRNSTSVYMEGMNDAYALALLVGDIERIEKYKRSIQEGMRFSLLTQYTPEGAFYIGNPTRAIGGFRASLTDNSQRIDYTQHAVFALLKSLQHAVFE